VLTVGIVCFELYDVGLEQSGLSLGSRDLCIVCITGGEAWQHGMAEWMNPLSRWVAVQRLRSFTSDHLLVPAVKLYCWTSRLPCFQCSYLERFTVGRYLLTVAAYTESSTKMHLFQISYPGLTFSLSVTLLVVLVAATAADCLGRVKSFDWLTDLYTLAELQYKEELTSSIRMINSSKVSCPDTSSIMSLRTYRDT